MIPAESRLRSPLVSGYLVQNLLKNRFLRLADAILSALFRGARRGFPIEAPRRILLCNLAHMGDVLASTALLPILRRRLPGVEIGFLIGSWSRPILDGHPDLARIHCFDHAFHNRSPAGRAGKLARHLRTRRRAVREIRAAGYDVALDLYYHVGNAIPLLRSAGIPVRVGFPTGGFASLLTHVEPWRYEPEHVARTQARLLGYVAPGAEAEGLRYSPALPAGAAPPAEAPYVVFHMGTGLPLKEWPLARWKELAARMAGRGFRIHFTGVGRREEENAEAVMRGLEGCRSYCGRLDWKGFLGMLQGARLVVCSDSLAAHLAAAFARPVVVISSGLNDPHHWRPLGDRVEVVYRRTPCSPCFRSGGCAGMECVREVEVEEVFAPAVRLALAEGEG